MSTMETRINITAHRPMTEVLKRLAKRDGVPLATKAAELIRVGLELEEDLALGLIADERLKNKKVKYLSHGRVWR